MVQIHRPPGAPQASRPKPPVAPFGCSVSQKHAGTRCSSVSTRCSSASGCTDADCMPMPCTARAESVISCPLPAFSTCRSEIPVAPRRCSSAQLGKQGAGRRCRFESVSLRGLQVERCSCCTKQEFWTFYDVFAAMDRRGVGAIQRSDFSWALSALGASLDFQKTCRRAALPSYFRDTAKDLSMEVFFGLLLPSATASDLEQMKHWKNLRQALKRLTCPGLRKPRSGKQEKGGVEELRDVFQLLCRAGSSQLPAGVLLQAEILTLEELSRALPQSVRGTDLGFEEFSTHIQPVLLEKYGSAGEDDFESDWRVAAHSRFQGTRASMLTAWEDETNSSRFGRTAERQPQHLPWLPLQDVAACKGSPRRRCKRSARRRGGEHVAVEARSPRSAF